MRDLNDLGDEMEERLRPSTAPIAVKLLEDEGAIPVGAVRPKKDRGTHLALRQAFAMPHGRKRRWRC